MSINYLLWKLEVIKLLKLRGVASLIIRTFMNELDLLVGYHEQRKVMSGQVWFLR
jgi:hypothetical protein